MSDLARPFQHRNEGDGLNGLTNSGASNAADISVRRRWLGRSPGAVLAAQVWRVV